MANPKHRTKQFVRNGATAREHANANPNTRCRICHQTLDQIRQQHPNATWDYGHPPTNNPTIGMGIECSHCNRSRGAHHQHQTHTTGYNWPQL